MFDQHSKYVILNFCRGPKLATRPNFKDELKTSSFVIWLAGERPVLTNSRICDFECRWKPKLASQPKMLKQQNAENVIVYDLVGWRVSCSDQHSKAVILNVGGGPKLASRPTRTNGLKNICFEGGWAGDFLGPTNIRIL